MGRGGGATWGRELSRARGRLSRPPHLPRSHTLTHAPFPPGHAQLVCKSHGKALASGQSSPSPSPAHSLHPRSPLHGIYCAPRRLDRRLPGLGTASLPPHPAPGRDREKQTPGGPGLHRSLGLSAWPAAALPCPSRGGCPVAGPLSGGKRSWEQLYMHNWHQVHGGQRLLSALCT